MNTKQLETRIIRRRNVIKENLLKEGITKAVAGDVVQFLSSAAAEYGIDFGTGGVGIPVGVLSETFIDSLFAAKSIDDAIMSIKDVASQTKEFQDVLKNVMGLSNALRNDYDKFYKDVNSIMSDFFKMSSTSENEIDTVKEKLKIAIDKLIDKFSDAAVKGIKVLIPDASVGLAIGAALRTVLSNVTSEPYDSATNVLEKSEKFKDFLLSPGVASKFFNEMGKKIIDLMKKSSEKIEEESWLKTAAAAISVPVAAPVIVSIKAIGPAGLLELSKQIEENLPTLVKICDQIVSIVIPGLFACFAILQSIQNDDWKSAKPVEKQQKSEVLLRNFIKTIL